MILTCPECATRYFVGDDSVGAGGRTVRCAACSATWLAMPEAPPLELTPQAPSEVLMATPDADPEAASLRERPAEQLPQAFRARAEERRRIREAAAVGAVWAGIGAGVLLLLAAAAVFRADMVRLWPKTASAYAAVGLPVNTTGINIEGVEAQPGLQDGRAAVVVTGALRNIKDRPVMSPALRINLLNKSGKPVQAKIASPADPLIPPGETRHFTISLLDPPASAASVEVVFDMTRKVRPAAVGKPEGQAAPVAALRPTPPAPAPAPIQPPGPPPDPGTVEEAHPLTGDAPFALPSGAAQASVAHAN